MLGNQYRNAVFTRNTDQETAAQVSLKRRALELDIALEEVKTPIIPITEFTIAERYHQKYRIGPRDEIRLFLEETYPKTKSFADSTVATRLNSVLGSGTNDEWQIVLDELPLYGLPEKLENRVRTEGTSS